MKKLLLGATLGLLLILFGFLTIWVAYGSPSGLIQTTTAQRARAERMVKDALVLVYRPAAEHTTALSELQDTLPLWEKAQRGLQQGDASLGLPHPPSDVSLLLMQASADYTPMDVAFAKILLRPDSVQLQIVLMHEASYFVLMSSVSSLWQQKVDATFWHLFCIEASLVVVIFALVIVQFAQKRRGSL